MGYRDDLICFKDGDAAYIIGRRMRVNGRNVLSLDYSRKTKVEKIYDDHTQFTLKVQVSSTLNSKLVLFVSKCVI